MPFGRILWVDSTNLFTQHSIPAPPLTYHGSLSLKEDSAHAIL